MKLVFLLEEMSTKTLLDRLLPSVLPPDVPFVTIPHAGKQALERSIPRKLKAWNEPDVSFIIVEDQDTSDCLALKQRLQQLCDDTGKEALIRIACQEMEAWYFGDLNAVAEAYGKPRLKELSRKSKFRDPDAIPSPKEELYKLVPEHQQILGAKMIAPHMSIEKNTSVSFQVLMKGIKRILDRST